MSSFMYLSNFYQTHCSDLDLNDQNSRRSFWQWFLILKNIWKLKYKREKKTLWINGIISKTTHRMFFSLFIFIYFSNMKPLSEGGLGLLDIQIQIQAVCKNHQSLDPSLQICPLLSYLKGAKYFSRMDFLCGKKSLPEWPQGAWVNL